MASNNNVSASSNGSSSQEELDKEEDFYLKLSDQFGEKLVKRLRKRNYRGKSINWYLLHKYAKEFSYTKSVARDRVSTNRARLTFDKVVGEYAKSFHEENYQKLLKEFGFSLKKSYDLTSINDFIYDHELKVSQDNDDDAIEARKNMSNLELIEKHIKAIEITRNEKSTFEDDVFTFAKNIREIIIQCKKEYAKLPDLPKILFYGRNGAGKSTLINSILFSTTNSILINEYKAENSGYDVKEVEAVRLVSALVGEDKANEARNEIAERWSSIEEMYVRAEESDFDNKKDHLSQEEVSAYELIKFDNLIDSFTSWKDKNEFANETEFLNKLTCGDDRTMLGAVGTYALKLPGKGNQGSCTSYITYVRHGARWQAVINLFPLHEILSWFDIETEDPELKENVWNALLKVSEKVNDNASSSSTTTSSDIPNTKENAEQWISDKVKEYFDQAKGFVIISPGEDPTIDRMIVREKMLDLVNKFGPLIKDATLFVPSTLLKTHGICLVDAPGADDADWIKGKQLVKACDIADAIVMVSKRDLKAGISLDGFSEFFGAKLLRNPGSLPIFIYLREENENKSTSEHLKRLPQNRKRRESDKNIKFVTNSISEFSQNLADNDDERNNFQETIHQMRIEGGYFFYTWCALRAFGNAVTSEEERNFLLNESGYNDLYNFLSARGTPVPEVEDNSSIWVHEVKNEIDKMRQILNKNLSETALKKIKTLPKPENDPLLHYGFKELLQEHPFFWDSMSKSSVNKSKNNACEFMDEIDMHTAKIAAKISRVIEHKLNIERKEVFKRKVRTYWTKENISSMLNPTVPDIAVSGEFRMFPEFIRSHIDQDDFAPYFGLFNEKILPEYIKLANEAIRRNLFKRYVDIAAWRVERNTRSNAANETYETKLQEGLEKDEEFAQAYRYVETIQKMPWYEKALKTKVLSLLDRVEGDFMKHREILSAARHEIKKYLFEGLKQKIKGRIDPDMILSETVSLLNKDSLRDIIKQSVTKTIKAVFESLFDSFTKKKNAIFIWLIKDYIKEQRPVISNEKKAVILLNLEEIETICKKYEFLEDNNGISHEGNGSSPSKKRGNRDDDTNEQSTTSEENNLGEKESKKRKSQR